MTSSYWQWSESRVPRAEIKKSSCSTILPCAFAKFQSIRYRVGISICILLPTDNSAFPRDWVLVIKEGTLCDTLQKGALTEKGRTDQQSGWSPLRPRESTVAFSRYFICCFRNTASVYATTKYPVGRRKSKMFVLSPNIVMFLDNILQEQIN